MWHVHLHYSQITAYCMALLQIFCSLFVCIPRFGKAIYECSNACQLIKKIMLLSQDSVPFLPKLVKHKIPRSDLFTRWNQAAMLVFQM